MAKKTKKKKRRSFTERQATALVQAYDALEWGLGAAFLRKKEITSAHIAYWRERYNVA